MLWLNHMLKNAACPRSKWFNSKEGASPNFYTLASRVLQDCMRKHKRSTWVEWNCSAQCLSLIFKYVLYLGRGQTHHCHKAVFTIKGLTCVWKQDEVKDNGLVQLINTDLMSIGGLFPSYYDPAQVFRQVCWSSGLGVQPGTRLEPGMACEDLIIILGYEWGVRR